jgi:hypothetical protein
MKHSTHFVILISPMLLVGCTTLKPQDYGLRPVAIAGLDYYCAPREWVVPPLVPQDAAGDPLFPLYEQFLNLPDRYIGSDGQARTPEVCITQAQVPQWLMMRTKWNRDWAVTPATAQALLAGRHASGQ